MAQDKMFKIEEVNIKEESQVESWNEEGIPECILPEELSGDEVTILIYLYIIIFF